jgi:hypothetical protein
MTDASFLDSQNPADLERGHVRSLRGEICPASSHDAYQAVGIKAEVPSDAEAEEDPLAITSPRIQAELEVSCLCIHVRRISQIQVSFDLRTLATLNNSHS